LGPFPILTPQILQKNEVPVVEKPVSLFAVGGVFSLIVIYHTIVMHYNVRYTEYVNNKNPTIRLGKNMKRIREKKQMSQGDICRAINFDRAFISNIESGKGNPTLATIEKIAQALNVGSDELLKKI
jgi:DNA-binding XRE family transcriptional regulator